CGYMLPGQYSLATGTEPIIGWSPWPGGRITLSYSGWSVISARVAALLEDRCRSCGCGRSVQRVRWAGSRTACRLLAAWLINDVPACRFLAVAWLKRGAQPAGPKLWQYRAAT